MSIATEISQALPGVCSKISIIKDGRLHGQKATIVVVETNTGKTISGTFTTEDKEAFGGVQFSQKKDIAALMTAKVQSVMAGTADARS